MSYSVGLGRPDAFASSEGHTSMDASFSVTTMTFTCKLSRAVCVERVWMTLLVAPPIVCIRSPCGSECRPAGVLPKGRVFGSQVTILTAVGASRSCNVKVFANGSMQITGAQCQQGADAAQAAVIRALRTCLGEDDLTADAPHARMISAVAHEEGPIDRGAVFLAAREGMPDIHVAYDPSAGQHLSFKLCFTKSVSPSHSDGVCRCKGVSCALVSASKSVCHRCCVTVHNSGCIVMAGNCLREHLARSLAIVRLVLRRAKCLEQ